MSLFQSIEIIDDESYGQHLLNSTPRHSTPVTHDNVRIQRSLLSGNIIHKMYIHCSKGFQLRCYLIHFRCHVGLILQSTLSGIEQYSPGRSLLTINDLRATYLVIST